MSGAGRSKTQPGGRRALLWPLGSVYAAGLAVKNMAYDRHWLPSAELTAPVISVGNLSVGGAGKTPLVIRLAELLAARGFDVDVLSRGYGRRSNATEQVRPGNEPDAAGAPGRGHSMIDSSGPRRFGDEPLLIAQAGGVPVYVGRSRYSAGRLAEQRAVAGPRVHLLDDGFQHRRLARVVDIVVLHRSDLSQGLLPAGRLREPLSALARASIAVLRIEDADLEPVLRIHFGRLILWQMERKLELPAPRGAEAAVAFCGIAHPAEFFSSLTRAGVLPAATHSFRDHHPYTDADMRALTASVATTGARLLLTTEKDLVRLSAVHRSVLGQAAKLQAVPLCVRLVEEDAAIAQLLALAGLPGPA